MLVHEQKFRKVYDQLREYLTCPICGLPKVHSRLRGYYCHFEDHNEIERLKPYYGKSIVDDIRELFSDYPPLPSSPTPSEE